MNCPLCLHDESSLYDQDKERSFFQCSRCTLVFVPRSDLVSLSAEKERYDAHENSSESDGYRTYLTGIANAIHENLEPGSRGLDFGSGKTTLLENILEEKGHDVLSYDVFFHPDVHYMDQKFDFIILSEVIEHLRDPMQEMEKLSHLLNENGKFFIKTKLLPEKGFSTWFYKRDITHVQFFSLTSFRYLSEKLSLKDAQVIGQDLFLFRNN